MKTLLTVSTLLILLTGCTLINQPDTSSTATITVLADHRLPEGMPADVSKETIEKWISKNRKKPKHSSYPFFIELVDDYRMVETIIKVDSYPSEGDKYLSLVYWMPKEETKERNSTWKYKYKINLPKRLRDRIVEIRPSPIDNTYSLPNTHIEIFRISPIEFVEEVEIEKKI